MSTMASKITSLAIVYATFYSSADQRKYQSSASLAFVCGIHRWPVNSPHKRPVTWKMFPFDDVIMENLDSVQWWKRTHLLFKSIAVTSGHQGWWLLKLCSLISSLRKFWFIKYTCQVLQITFIFDGCHSSWAAATPVKYEHDIQQVTNIFAMVKNRKINAM